MQFLRLKFTVYTLVVARSGKPHSKLCIKSNLLLTDCAWNLSTLRNSPILPLRVIPAATMRGDWGVYVLRWVSHLKQLDFSPFERSITLIRILSIISVIWDYALWSEIYDQMRCLCLQWDPGLNQLDICPFKRSLTPNGALIKIPLLQACEVVELSLFELFMFTIDLFTNVSQIYGCFFPRDLVMSHFINLYLTMVFQYLESTLHTLGLLVATSDKLSGCQWTTFVKMACIKLVNPSIRLIFLFWSNFTFTHLQGLVTLFILKGSLS